MSIKPFDEDVKETPREWKIQRWTSVSDPSEKAIRSAFFEMVRYAEMDEKAMDYEMVVPLARAEEVEFLGAFSELEYQSLQPCLLDQRCDDQSMNILDNLEREKGSAVYCGAESDEPFCAIAIMKPKESRKHVERNKRIPVVFFGTVERESEYS